MRKQMALQTYFNVKKTLKLQKKIERLASISEKQFSTRFDFGQQKIME